MKLQHHVPSVVTVRLAESAVVDAAYQAEVDRATARAERRQRQLERARARLAAAEVRRAAVAASARTTPEQMREAIEMVERRRAEVVRLMQLMRATPSGSANRGRGEKKQPVPPPALI